MTLTHESCKYSNVGGFLVAMWSKNSKIQSFVPTPSPKLSSLAKGIPRHCFLQNGFEWISDGSTRYWMSGQFSDSLNKSRRWTRKNFVCVKGYNNFKKGKKLTPNGWQHLKTIIIVLKLWLWCCNVALKLGNKSIFESSSRRFSKTT